MVASGFLPNSGEDTPHEIGVSASQSAWEAIQRVSVLRDTDPGALVTQCIHEMLCRSDETFREEAFASRASVMRTEVIDAVAEEAQNCAEDKEREARSIDPQPQPEATPVDVRMAEYVWEALSKRCRRSDIPADEALAQFIHQYLFSHDPEFAEEAEALANLNRQARA